MKLGILATRAAELAERNGWHKVSIEALAADLDVSRMTVSRAGVIGKIHHEAAKVVQAAPEDYPRAYIELALNDTPKEKRIAMLGALTND